MLSLITFQLTGLQLIKLNYNTYYSNLYINIIYRNLNIFWNFRLLIILLPIKICNFFSIFSLGIQQTKIQFELANKTINNFPINIYVNVFFECSIYNSIFNFPQNGNVGMVWNGTDSDIIKARATKQANHQSEITSNLSVKTKWYSAFIETGTARHRSLCINAWKSNIYFFKSFL